MRCGQCHQQIGDDALFCPKCGTSQSTDYMCIHCRHPVKANQKCCTYCGKSPELKCSHCGASLRDGQKFCSDCGKRVHQHHAQQSCCNCGTPVDDNETFCGECGSPISGGSVPPSSSQFCTALVLSSDSHLSADPHKSERSINPQASSPDPQASSSDTQASSPDPQAPLPYPQASPSDPQTPLLDPQASPPDPQAPPPDPQPPLPEPQAPLPEPQASPPDPEAPPPDPQAPSPDPQASPPEPQAPLPEPQAVTPDPQAPPPEPQAPLPEPQAVTPDPQPPLPEPRAVTPDPQAPPPDPQPPLPEPQAVTPDPQPPLPEPQAVTPDPQAPPPDPQPPLPEPQAPPSEPQDPPPDPQPPLPEPQASSSDPQAPLPDPQASSSDPQAPPPDPQASSSDPKAPPPDSQAVTPDPQAPLPELQASSSDPKAPPPDSQAVTPDPQASSSDPQAPLPELQASSSDPKAQSPDSQARPTDSQAPLTNRQASSADPQAPLPESQASSSVSEKLSPHREASSKQKDSAGDLACSDSAVAGASGGVTEVNPSTASDTEDNDGDCCSSEENEEAGEEESGDFSQDRNGAQARGTRSKKKRRGGNRNARRRKQGKRQQQNKNVKPTQKVVFHVVLSSKFKQFQANNHRVFLGWTPDEEKPSLENSIELHRTEREGDNGRLYEASVDTSLVPIQKYYKYFVELDGKCEWEKLYFSNRKDSRNKPCRELRLPPKETLKKGPWHIFDWMAYPKGLTGMYDSFRHFVGATSSRDTIAQDCWFAFSLFLPSPEMIFNYLSHQGDRTAEEILHLMKIVGQSAVTSTCFDGISMLFIPTYVLKPLEERIVQAINDGKSTAVLAMFLLHLFELAHHQTSWEEQNLVFRALLIQPDLEKRTCPDLDQLRHHFPNLMRHKDGLANKLAWWISQQREDSRPFWLYAMPLIHLSSGCHQPFLPLAPDEKHRSATWWGTSPLENKFEGFKIAACNGWYPETYVQVYQNMKTAFKADPLMLRTFVASLNLEQVLNLFRSEDIAAEIVMATLFFYLNTEPQRCHFKYKDIVQIIETTQETVQACIKSTEHVKAQDKNHYTMLGAIVEDLLKEVTETHRQDHAIIQAVVILQLTIITMLARHDQCNIPRNKVIIDQLYYSIKTWSSFSWFRSSDDFEPVAKFIERFIGISGEISNITIAQELKNFIQMKVKEQLEKLPPVERLGAFIRLMEREDMLDSVAGEDVHAYLEQALAEDQHRIEHFVQLQNFGRIQELLSDLYKAKCSRKNVTSWEGELDLLFMWKPMVFYLSSLNRQVTPEVAAKIEGMRKHLLKLKEKVISGQILVNKLQWLLRDGHDRRFDEVVQAVARDTGEASEALKLRARELEAFQLANTEVQCLLQFCQEFITTDDARTEYNNFREQSGNFEGKKVTDICKTPATPGMFQVENYTPEVHLDAVPERFRKYLPKLTQRLNSKVFKDLVQKWACSTNILPASKFWEVLVSVWGDAESEWGHVCEAMRDGQITVQEVEKLFLAVPKDEKWIGQCRMEMQNMCEKAEENWMEQRMQQFLCLSRKNTLQEIAVILCEIKEEFDFSGDVENMLHFQKVDETQPIGKLDLSVVETSEALQDIEKENVQHFHQFGSEKCSKFVKWVRETMAGDGMKELKVFVDLALNYVGDDPREMDKIRNLRSVITGYAPLIFQTDTDATFLDRCCKVARNIKADADLPAKLEGTVSLVQWFDHIHKFHGAVEKTAMAQVESITSRGILKVGLLQQAGNTETHLDLSNVMCLEVAADSEGEDRGRTYSYQELLDLQSRLMLVVGPEDQDRTSVDRFISVMDSVVRLVRTYIQLCQDGCLLFINWMVKFFFDQSRGVCCIIEFVHEGRHLKGLQDVQQSQTLEHYIAAVANFLESSHNDWLMYVAQSRKSYEDLNTYTMDQLVFLQEQLAKKELKDMSPQTFSLLSLLTTDCSHEKLQTAIEQAVDQMENQTDKAEEETEDVDDETRQVAEFIKMLEENGFSRQLSIKAVKSGVDSSIIEEGITWCIEHGDDEDEDEVADIQEEKHDLSASMTCLNTSVLEGTIATALQIVDASSEDQLSLDSVRTHLSNTWRLFLERVTSSGDDYLSLQHIGCVLRILTEEGIMKVDRKLPPPMSTNSPNLVVCPKSDVLKVVTSLYMFTKEAPLPQPDEVLLCSPQTSKEQVSMFCQRAFSSRPSQTAKIHCLAFADHLHFEVGQFADKELKEFINTTQHPYQLVVVCTAENEFNSGLTASLERYSRPAPISAMDTQTMISYLHGKFTVPDNLGSSPVAEVDPERLCVRVVKSSFSGMGKTLYVKRCVSQLKTMLEDEDEEDDDADSEAGESRISLEEETNIHITVPLFEKHISSDDVAATLLLRLPPSQAERARIIHLDIAYEVQEGVDHLLYNLLVLGCVTDSRGHVWRRSMLDLFLVEAMPLLEYSEYRDQKLMHEIFSILPGINCASPLESLAMLGGRKETAKDDHKLLFDEEEYRSTVFQRPYHYLKTLGRLGDPKPFKEHQPRALNAQSRKNCLEILLRQCGMKDPSWSELHRFVSFLNKQLEDFEHSIFCSSDVSDDLPGFPAFVLKFLISMSRDFATRSLNVSEESLPVFQREESEEIAGNAAGIEQFQMRRTWESSPHPYIFFNPDQTSMTFLGFTVDPSSGRLISKDGQVVDTAIMKRSLYHSLAVNGVPLSEDFDSLDRGEKLLRLYQVMGVPEDERTRNGEVVDPDDTYELTTDNAKKILAIYMRFRCNIPVIVMGETGCGKTRLVQFLCALQMPKMKNASTMIIMKVHGGTTSKDIYKKVKEAECLAKEAKTSLQQTASGSSHPLYTVLFFDEANTTEAIGAIKEVMCDGAMNGTPIQLHNDLKMVAACNPYRKHSKPVIERLEKAGLGYHVSAEKTSDKLGRVPMRQLVYRVQPLPQSMLPLVWDFGQLTQDVEHIYITQIVRHYAQRQLLGEWTQPELDTLCKLLVQCQTFMRNVKDECSFVSLRDAERALKVTGWFLGQTQLLTKTQDRLRDKTSDITKALVLALSVCYRAGLPDREKFEENIAKYFQPHFDIRRTMDFRYILESCQDVLLEGVKLGDRIARNQALKENVFMMVVCVELRIPLFLVGKPGSSKSLAKAIVSDAMQGQEQATGSIFSTLKEVQMISFQCSPLATADSILATFRQCAQLQQDRDRKRFVAVAVLDEVGLAEDSPHMPLKALHPLLEDGYEMQEKVQKKSTEENIHAEEGQPQDAESTDEEEEEQDQDISGELSDDDISLCPGFDSEHDIEEEPDAQDKGTRHEKVAFIGISNWALDPAKMNRGILVQRNVPDKKELVKTALNICQSSQGTEAHVNNLVHRLAAAYLQVFEKVCEHAMGQREFFGLRDFYSLVKMVHTTATQKGRKVTKSELQAAVRRNFGGLDFDPVKIFEDCLERDDIHRRQVKDDTDSSYPALLRIALSGEGECGENRYLLLLTENYGGLHILTDILLEGHLVEPIFGSSFPRDQMYTQICRNINRIKICMETGKTVILLNLDNLYESLYDALNQYYSYLCNTRYVDLGLGTHRVKCKVDTKFRLIVVAEKQMVYNKFPIPLINRLEKHFLTVNSLLTKDQHRVEQQLQQWIEHIVHCRPEHGRLGVNDLWIGFNSDTAASIVLTVWKKHLAPQQEQKILEECKAALLWCATPDAVIRTQDKWCEQTYFQEQQHDSLAQYLQAALQDSKNADVCLMAQVTTHSKLLTEVERGNLEKQLDGYSFTLLSLQAFHTEQQFRHQLSLFLGHRGSRVLLIQCERGHENKTLLQCAQYCVQSLWAHHQYQHVLFLVQLPRVTSLPFTGYIGGQWQCLHMDDLRSPPWLLPSFAQLQAASPAQLLASSLAGLSTETSETTEAGANQDGVTSQSLSLDLVRHLMAACVQSAVARIRDGTTSSNRATDRIAILLQWLENPGEEFLRGILQMVCALMHEKEAMGAGAMSSAEWLTQRAAHPESLRKTSTMRRAWQQCLEEEIVPVLAGVVAYLDTNHNLDLLKEEGWLLDMWLQILNHPHLCQLQYSELLSLRNQPSQLKEFPCHSMFVTEESASPALPFSWLLWENIEAYLAHNVALVEEENVMEAMEQSVLGHFLKTAVSREDMAQEFVERYVADLVYHRFRVQAAQHQLLVQCMKQAMDQASVTVQASRLSVVLIRVHQVMACVQPRLQTLLDLTACHPRALQNLQQHRHDPGLLRDLSGPELFEDILLLKMLAEELTPGREKLNTNVGCREWLNHFSALAPVLSGVLEDADTKCSVDDNMLREERRLGQMWLPYGPWCRTNLAAIRCLWTRVMSVKLFIDFMRPLATEKNSLRLEPINYNLLWTILTDTANMKTQKTLSHVDMYLKQANTQMVKHLLGDVGKCTHCAIKLQGPPVVLPCSHRICNICYTQDVCINHICPECRQAVPPNFQPDAFGCCDREKVERLNLYQQQTSAFLMAVISQLAFGGQTPPEPSAVEHIFSYIIRRAQGVTTVQTQQLTLHDDQLDPSPVLRSFILRLLLKQSEEKVSEHISRYLEDAKQRIRDHMGDHNPQSSSVLRELSLLIIHCVENLEHEKEVRGVADRTLADSFSERCTRVKNSLHQVRCRLESSPLELATLTAVGQLRFALSMCASMLHSHVVQAAEGAHLTFDFRDLLKEACIICTMGISMWPRVFLVKSLCREFGVQAYMTLIQHAKRQPVLRWLKLEDVQQADMLPDRYLLCGPQYKSVREELTAQLRQQDGQFTSSLKDCTLSKEQQQYLALLALHREVPVALVSANQHTKTSITERAVTLLQSGAYPVDLDFALNLVKNNLGAPGSSLHVDSNQGLADQSLVCIVIHFWLALKSCQQQRNLLTPFIALIQHPDRMRNSLLPTMPQDDIDNVIQAMNIDQSKTIEDYNQGFEIPKLWECPRGHRYAIGDCGNPNAQGTCPECNVPIGGVRYHHAAAGNQLSQLRDRTQTGHILGAAQDRSEEAVPERKMSAAACSVVRFLTHAALYLSAAQPGQAASVSSMIQPAVEEADVTAFLWAHLNKDLLVMQNALARSCDDVYLLLHHLCHQLLELSAAHFWQVDLRTKQDREKWEKTFCEKYIQPVFQQAETIVQTGYEHLMADTGPGQKELLNIVFEVGEEDQDPQMEELIQCTPAAWKYRLCITVEQFFREFQLLEPRKQDALPVLKLFLQQSHHLRALNFVPDILALQRRLLQQLHHRLSRVEAATIPVRQLLANKEGQDLQKLVAVFSKAWDIVRDLLANYRCCTEEGYPVQLPEELQTVRVTEDSPVGMVLPDTRGPGRCAYLLMHYLLVQHNHFLSLYCPLTALTYEELPEVQLSAVSRRHLVSYNPENDLLPLVLTHCNYSLHLGHSQANTSATRLHYDFSGFELQLQNSLLLSKSRVHRQQNGAFQMETLSYCADTTMSRLLNTLREKIPQESLDPRVQHQIVDELGENLTDICSSIDSLNTTLNFLLTVKVTADQLLHIFMMETLKMRDTEGVHSRKAQQHCRMKHVQCLWLLLCFHRARILTLHNQEAFDQQGQALRQDLVTDQERELTAVLQRRSPERIHLLLNHLFQCIMLNLLPQAQDQEFVHPDNYDLKWLLENCLENPLYTQSQARHVQDDLSADDLVAFPDSVRASQAISCWIFLLHSLKARQH